MRRNIPWKDERGSWVLQKYVHHIPICHQHLLAHCYHSYIVYCNCLQTSTDVISAWFSKGQKRQSRVYIIPQCGIQKEKHRRLFFTEKKWAREKVFADARRCCHSFRSLLCALHDFLPCCVILSDGNDLEVFRNPLPLHIPAYVVSKCVKSDLLWCFRWPLCLYSKVSLLYTE